MSETEDYDKSATPTPHAASHEDGGSDEINVDALLGSLAEAQLSTWDLVSGKPASFTPAAHKTSHQDAGSDELSLTGLAGLTVTEQPSSWGQVSGKPSTFAPEAHHTSHEPGGSDAVAMSAGLFDIDILGDLEPITTTLYDQYYELDGLDDIMPRAA